jgi:hypothetical protein
MAVVGNTMTRAVEMWTCLCDKGMRLANKITRLEIDNLALISLAILLLLLPITLDLIILIDISSRLFGARTLCFRESAGWSRCEGFEKVLRGEVQAMCHASAKPHIEHP